ncbi:MAG: hypothetical protein ABH805_02745 [Candidatus Nealsonbacteria bacterium]
MIQNLIKQRPVLVAVVAILALGAIGLWFYQRNSYSKEILKLEILGPEEVALAQEVEYTVKYTNNGNVRLEDPRLVFEFPEYSLVGEGELLRKEIVLEDIYPGQERTLSFKTRLLGKEGDLKRARAWLNYQPKNLTARYESETSHTTQIKSVPLTLEFDLPSKIDSGKEVNFRLNYFSNADYPLSDLGIRIEQPSDFDFQSSQPSSLGETEWEVGLLNKAEGGRIEIIGNLKGEIGEQKQFRAQLGMWQDGEFVVLKETIRAVQITTPSLYISQQINGNEQYVASAGDTLHYEIFFKNIGNDSFNNLFLVARLEGDLFDFSTLKAPLGDFESGDNSIIFDWRRVSQLQFLGPQKEGKLEFWIEVKDDWPIKSPNDKNPVLRNRVFLSQAQREFTTKVNSRLEIVQQVFFQDDIFGNSGNIPPQVGSPTTYTVTWSVKNHYNDVKNMRVKAVLGEGVRLSGRIFPEGARFTFDSNSREVTWELENLDAGKGVLGAGPSIAFQIVLTPYIYQANQPVILVNEAVVSGEDQFTEQITQAYSSSTDTTLPDDPAISPDQGMVR